MRESSDPWQMSGFCDRQGNALTEAQWSSLLRDPDYRRVSQTVLGDVIVSTVWTGLDHSFGLNDSAPIFETIIIGGLYDDYRERYRTEASALSGHKRAMDLAMDAAVAVQSGALPGQRQHRLTLGR
jgi:hypothetical protein